MKELVKKVIENIRHAAATHRVPSAEQVAELHKLADGADSAHCRLVSTIVTLRVCELDKRQTLASAAERLARKVIDQAAYLTTVTAAQSRLVELEKELAAAESRKMALLNAEEELRSIAVAAAGRMEHAIKKGVDVSGCYDPKTQVRICAYRGLLAA